MLILINEYKNFNVIFKARISHLIFKNVIKLHETFYKSKTNYNSRISIHLLV